MSVEVHSRRKLFSKTRLKQEGRSRQQNDSEKGVKHMEERNLDTNEKSPKQGLTSGKELSLTLPDWLYCHYSSVQINVKSTKLHS